jgi:histidine triad (HIT) family protein
VEKTLFQKIIDREEPAKILFENEDYIIIDNKYPKAPIHYLLIPKKVIPSITEAVPEDTQLLGGLLLLAGSFAAENKIKNYKLVFNCGKYLHIRHLHLHFLAGDNLED